MLLPLPLTITLIVVGFLLSLEWLLIAAVAFEVLRLVLVAIVNATNAADIE